MTTQFRCRVTPWVVVSLTAVCLSACASTDLASTRAWIDVPFDGSEVAAGVEVEVMSHAYARAGVAEVLLAVNGVPYRRDPPAEPGHELTSVVQAWRPDAPGDYILEVVVYAMDGEASAPAVAWVRVLPGATFTAIVTPTRTVPPTSPQTPYGTLTAIVTPTRTVPPTIPRTPYVTYTAIVTPPADTTRPTINSVSASSNIIRMPNCTPNTVTITASASDNVGVSQAELVYRVSGGSWQTRSMSGSGGSYQATLDWFALEASRDPVPTTGGSVLEYYVRVRDAAGNSAESGMGSIAIAGCLI